MDILSAVVSMKVVFIVLVVLLVSLQIRFWVGEGSMADLTRLRSKVAEQKAENDRLVERNQVLAAEVRALKEGTEGIEKRAREDMGMIKEGETFYLIVDEE